LRTRKREMRGDVEIFMTNWNWREFQVRVGWPSPIQYVQVLIWWVITPIQGLPNPIRQVDCLNSHIRSYPTHGSHRHPPPLSFWPTTLTWLQKTTLSQPSLSPHVMIMSWGRVQHTPSTATTQDYFSSLYSQYYEWTPEFSFGFQCATLHNWPPSGSSPWDLKHRVFLLHSHGFELTNWWNSQHPVRRPSTASKYLSKLAWFRPPSWHNHGLQEHFQNLLDHSLQSVCL